MLARFVVNSHVKHHPNREEGAPDDEGLMVGLCSSLAGLGKGIIRGRLLFTEELVLKRLWLGKRYFLIELGCANALYCSINLG